MIGTLRVLGPADRNIIICLISPDNLYRDNGLLWTRKCWVLFVIPSEINDLQDSVKGMGILRTMDLSRNRSLH
jgi:hypothetical protein